jgi:hypothetical protein
MIIVIYLLDTLLEVWSDQLFWMQTHDPSLVDKCHHMLCAFPFLKALSWRHEMKLRSSLSVYTSVMQLSALYLRWTMTLPLSSYSRSMGSSPLCKLRSARLWFVAFGNFESAGMKRFSKVKISQFNRCFEDEQKIYLFGLTNDASKTLRRCFFTTGRSCSPT